MTDDFLTQRRRLTEDLQKQGIHDERVLRAIASIPREHFVEEALKENAYADRALPIGQGQTISQPLMVAVMTQALALTGWERVLEIGTGSGYQGAILAQLAAHVYSVERYPQLASLAAKQLVQLGIRNISVFIGDGSLGWAEYAPYDRIIVTAAAPEVPPRLLTQLVEGGLLVIPVGSQARQVLHVIQQTARGLQVQFLGNCIFVPLVGEEGWGE